MADYSPQDDQHIVEFLEADGLSKVAHELSRSAQSIQDRAKFLRSCGAWDFYQSAHRFLRKAMVQTGHMEPEIAALADATAPRPTLKLVGA